MEVIGTEVIASVRLARVALTEDELATYEVALDYALDCLQDAELERRFGATRDEIEGMRDDLRQAIEPQGKTTLKPVLA